MTDLEQYISIILEKNFKKIIISNPASKAEEYQKIVIEKKKDFCQIAKYTEKQVFHENVKGDAVLRRCVELIDGHYRQVNGMAEDAEHIILISKNGRCSYKVKRLATEAVRVVQELAANEHDRKKNIFSVRA